MRVLEIGSWCGDSAVEIGHEVRKYDGLLYCIDWWKGNPGTNLACAAQQVDIFQEFWRRIRAEGLDDTVIPLRGRSDDVVPVLADRTFDMVYIDGDHRYSQICADIGNCTRVVRDGGILCGDDCEGRRSDFDEIFLEQGKDVDFHETVHCGVVAAVGETFPEYSIDYSIWSVKRTGDGWYPTNLSLENVAPRRQSHPPMIESYREFNLVRYGRFIYAIPWKVGAIDITLDKDRLHPKLLKASSIEEARRLIDQY